MKLSDKSLAFSELHNCIYLLFEVPNGFLAIMSNVFKGFLHLHTPSRVLTLKHYVRKLQTHAVLLVK